MGVENNNAELLSLLDDQNGESSSCKTHPNSFQSQIETYINIEADCLGKMSQSRFYFI